MTMGESGEELIVPSQAPRSRELFLERPADSGALLPFLGWSRDPNHPSPHSQLAPRSTSGPRWDRSTFPMFAAIQS